MPKLVRVKTVEKLLRSLGHGTLADSLVRSVAMPLQDFKLKPRALRKIEERLANKEIVAVRRCKGSLGVMFLSTEGMKPFNFQRPEVQARAQLANKAKNGGSTLEDEVTAIAVEAQA